MLHVQVCTGDSLSWNIFKITPTAIENLSKGLEKTRLKVLR